MKNEVLIQVTEYIKSIFLDIKTQLDTLNVKTILQQENIVELEEKNEKHFQI
jgi:hypothetical protein